MEDQLFSVLHKLWPLSRSICIVPASAFHYLGMLNVVRGQSLIYCHLGQSHIPVSFSPRPRTPIPCVFVSSSHRFPFNASGKRGFGMHILFSLCSRVLNTVYVLCISCLLLHHRRTPLMGLVACLLQGLIQLVSPRASPAKWIRRNFTTQVTSSHHRFKI